MLDELMTTPKRATKVKKVFKGAKEEKSKYTHEEALALITAAQLSQGRYQMIRKSAIEKGLKIYPSYQHIQNAKKLCYPPDEDCTINESLTEIIQQFLFPIGQMSEEAQEARHKEFRKFRLEHSRKISRTQTNTDILHNLLISSDPVITYLKPQGKSKQTVIDSSVLQLIKPPILDVLQTQETDSESDSSISSASTGSDSE